MSNKSSPSLNTLINLPPLPAGFINALARIFATSELLTKPEECWTYGYENSRRHVLPQAVVFPAMHEQVAADSAATAIVVQPVLPYALEFIDGNAINMIRQYSTCVVPENAGAILMMEVDSQREGLDSAAQKVAATWQTRKTLSPTLRKVAPKKINEDVVVSVTENPTVIAGLDELPKQYPVPIINFGHGGNGNIHVNLLPNPDDPEQSARSHQCLDAVFSLVLKLNVTLFGEHDVGLEKCDFVDRALNANSLEQMRGIPKQFNPNGIVNEGKMLPLQATPINRGVS